MVSEDEESTNSVDKNDPHTSSKSGEAKDSIESDVPSIEDFNKDNQDTYLKPESAPSDEEISHKNQTSSKGIYKNQIEEKIHIRETRRLLAIILLSTYFVTLVGIFCLVGFSIPREERKEVLTLIVTSQVSLMGSALGFYFGKNQS